MGVGRNHGAAQGEGDGLGYEHGSGRGVGTGQGRRGSGSGGSGTNDLLRVIRQRIAQAIVYPEEARRQRQEGIVEMRFRISMDGSVEAVEVARSSGHAILDESAAQTVRRAAPYPVVTGWIRIPLSYRLAN